MKPVRVSSTILTLYTTCPRRWYYRYVADGGTPLVTNRAMALGTVTHAALEYWNYQGTIPTREDVEAMDGNYSDPVDVLRAFEAEGDDLWPESLQMMLAVVKENPEFSDDAVPEVSVEDLGLKLAGQPACGFFDVLEPSEQRITDYKTRGSFSYMPRTDHDFRSTVQLAYYGAAAAKAFDWDYVRVRHINILRPDRGGPEVQVIESRIDGWYLRKMWEILDSQWVPEMVSYARGGNEYDVPRNKSACFKYNRRCPFADGCDAVDPDEVEGGFLDRMAARLAKNKKEKEAMNPLSPQAPKDLEPVPFAEKHVEELGANTRATRNLVKAGIKTLSDFEERVAADFDFTSIPYVGAKTAEDLVSTFHALKKTQVL